MDAQNGSEPGYVESEVICIDEDSNSTISLTKKSCRPKRSHEKKHRKVKVEKTNNSETLVISQEVKVKKQKIQCIINLTNVCEYEETWKSRKCYKKHKYQKKHLEVQSELKSPKICIKEQKTPTTSAKLNWNLAPKKSPKVDLSAKVERIVPHCLRKRCRAAISTKCCRLRPRARSRNREHSKDLFETTHSSDIQNLSPISMSSLKLSSEPELEDISSDSFTICSDKYLDTLIKRTKDRERWLKETFEYKPPLIVSTPKNVEAADTETIDIRSEGDTSEATLILIPQLYPDIELYSPTRPTSPVSESENNFEPYNQQCEEYSLDEYTKISEANVKTECYKTINKLPEDDVGMEVDFKNCIKSNVIHENTNNDDLLPRNEEHTVKNEFIEKDLHAGTGSPVGIKQEKKSPISKDYSPKVPILWITNKEFDHQLAEKETKYFNKFSNVMPNTKVENSIDFTTVTERNINLRIKTEVNVKHEQFYCNS